MNDLPDHTQRKIVVTLGIAKVDISNEVGLKARSELAGSAQL